MKQIKRKYLDLTATVTLFVCACGGILSFRNIQYAPMAYFILFLGLSCFAAFIIDIYELKPKWNLKIVKKSQMRMEDKEMMEDREIEYGSHERLILDKLFGPTPMMKLRVTPNTSTGEYLIERELNGGWEIVARILGYDYDDNECEVKDGI